MIAKALAEMHALAFTEARAWSEKEFEELLKQNTVTLIGNAHSFILARHVADEVEILTLATHPKMLRQGLSSTNLQTLETRAVERHASSILLEVAADNYAAIALYQKPGFAQIASRQAYYERTNNTTVDALILQKKLGPT